MWVRGVRQCGCERGVGCVREGFVKKFVEMVIMTLRYMCFCVHVRVSGGVCVCATTYCQEVCRNAHNDLAIPVFVRTRTRKRRCMCVCVCVWRGGGGDGLM